MTRRGKIARLPKEIRATLNERLHNGERNDQLVEWLNAQKEVQEVLAAQFEGRAITEQNLSEWKTGGFKEWERLEVSKELVQAGKEASDDLDDAASEAEISDCSARLLAAEIMALQREMLTQEMTVQERWKLVCELHKQVSKMRKDDHQCVRTILAQEKWDLEQAERAEQRDRQFSEDFKKSEEEREKRLNAPLLARYDVPGLAKLYGGGKRGWELAAQKIELARGLPLGILQDRKGGKWRVVDNEWSWVKDGEEEEGGMQNEEPPEGGTPNGETSIDGGKDQEQKAPIPQRRDSEAASNNQSRGNGILEQTPKKVRAARANGKEDGGLKMEHGRKGKNPKSKRQAPEKQQTSKLKLERKPSGRKGTKGVEGRKTRAEGRKAGRGSTESRPTGEQFENNDGAQGTARPGVGNEGEAAETQLNPTQSELIQAKNLLEEGGDIAEGRLPIADLKAAPTDPAERDGCGNGEPPKGGTPNVGNND